MTTKVFVKIQVEGRKLSLRQEEGSFHVDAVLVDEDQTPSSWGNMGRNKEEQEFIEGKVIPVLQERLQVGFSLHAIYPKRYVPGWVYDLQPTGAVELDPFQFLGLEPEVRHDF